MKAHLKIPLLLGSIACWYSVAKGAPLRIGIEPSNFLQTSPYFRTLTACTLADAIKNKKDLPAQKTSKVWNIDLKDITFQNGSELTDEQVSLSLAQASPIQRAFIFSIKYTKNHLQITFTHPISDPQIYLKWPILSERPSLFCGKWDIPKNQLMPITLEKDGQRFILEVGSRETELKRLKNNEIDVFIPETWKQIEPFLRKNPQLKPLFSKRPKSLYLHLNPRKLTNLADRQSIFESLRNLDLPFPFSKPTNTKSSKVFQPGTINSDFTLGVPVDAHWLEASKLALTNLLDHIKKPVINVLDRESLFAEIKSGKLDAWLNDEELGYMTYHSQTSPVLYGPSGFAKPTLDTLMERAQLPDGSPALLELLEALDSGGIMMKIASIDMVALIAAKYRETGMSDEKILKLLENFIQ